MPTSPTALPPGFRFHPTDEELVLHYLRKHAGGLPCPVSIIAEVDIYKFDPWDLPGKAIFGDREWYFFSPRERKYPNGVRPNRAAASGYWKATGTDKPIRGVAEGGREGIVGVKKALVFYKGRPPRGSKTTWIMHEYRLAQPHATTYRPFKRKDSMRLDDWVLCRIYKKTTQELPPVTVPSTSTDTLQQDDAVSPGVDADTYAPQCFQGTPAAWLPKPPSVSDFLADYPAVSALFDGLPEAAGPLTSGGSNDGGSLIQQYYTAEPQAADGSAQKIFLEDCNNATLQLHASTRSLHGASIAMSSLSMDHAFPDLG